MEKPKHEPGEPSLEDLAQQYGEVMGKLHGARDLFLAKQKMTELNTEQEEKLFQNFEEHQIELILDGLSKEIDIPWVAHAHSSEDSASDVEATADTYFDPVRKKVTRYESTAAEGTEQVEIIMSYGINPDGRLERSISTETEIIRDPLDEIEHPAFRELDLNDREKANLSTAPDEIIRSELDLPQARQFVSMMRELIAKLVQVYNQPGWEIMFDTERSPHGVEPGDYRAVYKIERIELD